MPITSEKAASLLSLIKPSEQDFLDSFKSFLDARRSTSSSSTASTSSTSMDGVHATKYVEGILLALQKVGAPSDDFKKELQDKLTQLSGASTQISSFASISSSQDFFKLVRKDQELHKILEEYVQFANRQNQTDYGNFIANFISSIKPKSVGFNSKGLVLEFDPEEFLKPTGAADAIAKDLTELKKSDPLLQVHQNLKKFIELMNSISQTKKGIENLPSESSLIQPVVDYFKSKVENKESFDKREIKEYIDFMSLIAYRITHWDYFESIYKKIQTTDPTNNPTSKPIVGLIHSIKELDEKIRSNEITRSMLEHEELKQVKMLKHEELKQVQENIRQLRGFDRASSSKSPQPSDSELSKPIIDYFKFKIEKKESLNQKEIEVYNNFISNIEYRLRLYRFYGKNPIDENLLKSISELDEKIRSMVQLLTLSQVNDNIRDLQILSVRDPTATIRFDRPSVREIAKLALGYFKFEVEQKGSFNEKEIDAYNMFMLNIKKYLTFDINSDPFVQNLLKEGHIKSLKEAEDRFDLLGSKLRESIREFDKKITPMLASDSHKKVEDHTSSPPASPHSPHSSRNKFGSDR